MRGTWGWLVMGLALGSCESYTVLFRAMGSGSGLQLAQGHAWPSLCS